MSSPLNISHQDRKRFSKNSESGFNRDIHFKIGVASHSDIKYDLYQYFVPSSLLPVVKFLKKYFQFLDTICESPQIFSYRNTELEYADTAILALHQIRKAICKGQSIIAGCSKISPVPWAVFGSSSEIPNKLFRKHFYSVNSILEYYSPFICKSPFVSLKIHRPHHINNQDPLQEFSKTYNKGVNFILSASLLLLSDIIKHCGPECPELNCAFTNDIREETADEICWQIARENCEPPKLYPSENVKIKLSNTAIFHTCSTSNTENAKDIYFEVSICDNNTLSLSGGEVFEIWDMNKSVATPSKKNKKGKKMSLKPNKTDSVIEQECDEILQTINAKYVQENMGGMHQDVKSWAGLEYD